MKCSDLAAKLEKLNPTCQPQEIAQMCTTISSLLEDSETLYDEQQFQKIHDEVNLRLSFATDQHGAMVEELQQLTKSVPEEFTPDQVWVLVRAIKVQSQLLGFYTGECSTAQLN